MPGYIFPFEKLDVWVMAVELADYVLGLLEKLPENKHIRLISQMEAAVTSPAQLKKLSARHGRTDGFDLATSPAKSKKPLFSVVSVPLPAPLNAKLI